MILREFLEQHQSQCFVSLSDVCFVRTRCSFFLPLSRFYAEKFSLLIKYFCSEIRDGGSSKATELLNSVNGLWMEKRRMFDVFSLHLLSSLQISISKHLNIVEQKSTKFAMEQKKVSE